MLCCVKYPCRILTSLIQAKMALCYYDKKELKSTPSINRGMTVDWEQTCRKEGVLFIYKVGCDLGLKHRPLATAALYFQHFYMREAFQDFPYHITACACLLLSGKVEDTPKRWKAVRDVACLVLGPETFRAEFGKDPKDKVFTYEQILLRAIKFDFNLDLPYSFLMKYLKLLKVDEKKKEEVLQKAWPFVNDSFCATLCLQWEPEIIAIAVLHLSAKLSFLTKKHWRNTSLDSNWWDLFVKDFSVDSVEGVCHQILDYYEPNKKHPQKSKRSRHDTANKRRVKEPNSSSVGPEIPKTPSRAYSNLSGTPPVVLASSICAASHLRPAHAVNESSHLPTAVRTLPQPPLPLMTSVLPPPPQISNRPLPPPPPPHISNIPPPLLPNISNVPAPRLPHLSAAPPPPSAVSLSMPPPFPYLRKLPHTSSNSTNSPNSAKKVHSPYSASNLVRPRSSIRPIDMNKENRFRWEARQSNFNHVPINAESSFADYSIYDSGL